MAFSPVRHVATPARRDTAGCGDPPRLGWQNPCGDYGRRPVIHCRRDRSLRARRDDCVSKSLAIEGTSELAAASAGTPDILGLAKGTSIHAAHAKLATAAPPKSLPPDSQRRSGSQHKLREVVATALSPFVQSSSGSHLAAGCNRRAAAATEGAGLSCGASGQAVTSCRVIRRAPIRSGRTIQMASEVPACAHWVALMTYSVTWPRARA